VTAINVLIRPNFLLSWAFHSFYFNEVRVITVYLYVLLWRQR